MAGKRGAPEKAVRQANKDRKTKAKLVDEILKAEELIVDNYLDSVETIVKAAKGELKGVSTTNVISSAKVVVQWAEEIMAKEEANKAPVEGKEDSYQPEEEVSEVAPLISLVPQKANEK
ncbi:hypothetical protein NVP1170O_202 [Vibrio phage 1.170.O._10N.261.52.C3]|nr:hypothetical protein NVP1170O_202 [Vibrio phage 1.170.O._10N.261.52.C3]